VLGWTAVGRGVPLQETLGPGAIVLWDISAVCPDRADSLDGVQGHPRGGVGRQQTPGRAQHPPIRQGRQVAADEGGAAEPGGGVEEGRFRFGGLEQEQHQGL